MVLPVSQESYVSMHENPCAFVVQFPSDYVHVLVQLHVHPLVLTLIDGLYLFCRLFLYICDGYSSGDDGCGWRAAVAFSVNSF